MASAEQWSSFRPKLPRAADAEQLMVDHLFRGEVQRALDLGCGDGHMIAVVRERWPKASVVGLDISPVLAEAAQHRFSDKAAAEIHVHDLMEPLSSKLGKFDVVVSALAIHHLPDQRKRKLFAEVFELLRPGGAFYDLDVVTAPTEELHAISQSAFGFDEGKQDPSDQPARLEDQLNWLRELGFEGVDCFWKWLELALVGGTKPG